MKSTIFQDLPTSFCFIKTLSSSHVLLIHPPTMFICFIFKIPKYNQIYMCMNFLHCFLLPPQVLPTPFSSSVSTPNQNPKPPPIFFQLIKFKFQTSPLVQMRSKTQFPFILKFLIFGFFVAFLLLVLRSSLSSSNDNSSLTSQTKLSNDSNPIDEEDDLALSTGCPPTPSTKTCTKIPSSLAQALIHYSTSNITPQQTMREISVSSRILQKKSPCNFLVFGLGYDSLMWTALNHGGRTIFLEEDESWIENIKEKFPTLNSYHVVYDTKVHQADELMAIGKGKDCTVVSEPKFSKCQLALTGLPNEVYETEWDLIMVDAPTGYHDGAPGRMSAIYTAGLLARNREEGETDIFVHDVDRVVEDKFSKSFLCDGYMKQQEGRLRHFIIPSHKSSLDMPFCPQ